MCGIVGIQRRGNLRPHEWDGFRRMWIAASERGTDACGYILSTGRWITFGKAPIDSELAVGLLPAYSPGVNWLIGHTRAATQGGPENPLNNHPIVTGTEGTPIYGVHNGIIFDTEEVDLKTGREVDSGEIFYLLQRYGPESPECLEKVCGSLAIAYAHLGNPAVFYLARGAESPICYVQTKGTLAFASTPEILRKAGITGKVVEMQEGTWIKVRNGQIAQTKHFKPDTLTWGRRGYGIHNDYYYGAENPDLWELGTQGEAREAAHRDEMSDVYNPDTGLWESEAETLTDLKRGDMLSSAKAAADGKGFTIKEFNRKQGNVVTRIWSGKREGK